MLFVFQALYYYKNLTNIIAFDPLNNSEVENIIIFSFKKETEH